MKGIRNGGAVVALLITLIVISDRAVAQDRLLARVDIPFSFSAFNQTFSPGLYELKQIGAQVIRLRNASSNIGVTLLTPQTIGQSSTIGIFFREYGSERFLAAIVAPSYTVSIESSGRERELARASSAVVREVAVQ